MRNCSSDVISFSFQGVENSFPTEWVRKRFYQKYYQLLLHGQFPQKESKLCLVGPSDSGKTSWFSPFQGKKTQKVINFQPIFISVLLYQYSIALDFVLGLIPSRYIAGVMNDGKFSASLITEESQVVFMDEWSPDSLSCEDAKRVLQGNTYE